MCETLYHFMSVLSTAIFETFYICCWFFFLAREFYKIFIYPIKCEINTLKNKQDILYKSIKKLKNIIDIDIDTAEELTTNFNAIKLDIDSIYISFGKRLDKLEEQCFASETNTSEEEDEYEDEDDEDEDEDEETNFTIPTKDILPIQNHITFPHFTIYKNNLNKCKTKDRKSMPKIISYQLSDFLGIEPGNSMSTEEIYYVVETYIKKNIPISKNNIIKIVPKIQKLFGISENEDYEITMDNLYKFIEPHLK
jgi:hypothetical protein